MAVAISMGWTLFIAFAVLVGGGNIILGSQAFARRRFGRIARGCGLAYDPEARGLRSVGCDVLPVFAWLKAHRNLMHGTTAGVETAFIELGKEGEVEDPLVPNVFSSWICFRSPGRAIPPFHVLRHRGEGVHGLKGVKRLERHVMVDLRDNPGFPFHYLVLAQREEDVEAVRGLFSRLVQDFFMERRDSFLMVEVEGAGEWVGLTGLTDLAAYSTGSFRDALETGQAVHALFGGQR